MSIWDFDDQSMENIVEQIAKNTINNATNDLVDAISQSIWAVLCPEDDKQIVFNFVIDSTQKYLKIIANISKGCEDKDNSLKVIFDIENYIAKQFARAKCHEGNFHKYADNSFILELTRVKNILKESHNLIENSLQKIVEGICKTENECDCDECINVEN